MKPPKILLVEDNADEEALAMAAFARAGLDTARFFVVRDGQEAVDYLFGEGKHAQRNSSDLPQVVFLDINLPKLSGLEVLKRIRQDSRTLTLPVVMLTSSEEPQDVHESYRMGANSFIRKAFSLKTFVSDIKAMQGYWLKLNLVPYEH